MTGKTRVRRIGPLRTGDVILTFGEHDLRLTRSPMIRLTAYEVRAAYRELYSTKRTKKEGRRRATTG